MKSFRSSLWPLPNEQRRNTSPTFLVLLMILYDSDSSQEVPFLQWKDKYMTPKLVCMFMCAVCALVYECSCVWANVSKCKCACMDVWRGQRSTPGVFFDYSASCLICWGREPQLRAEHTHAACVPHQLVLRSHPPYTLSTPCTLRIGVGSSPSSPSHEWCRSKFLPVSCHSLPLVRDETFKLLKFGPWFFIHGTYFYYEACLADAFPNITSLNVQAPPLFYTSEKLFSWPETDNSFISQRNWRNVPGSAQCVNCSWVLCNYELAWQVISFRNPWHWPSGDFTGTLGILRNLKGTQRASVRTLDYIVLYEMISADVHMWASVHMWTPQVFSVAIHLIFDISSLVYIYIYISFFSFFCYCYYYY